MVVVGAVRGRSHPAATGAPPPPPPPHLADVFLWVVLPQLRVLLIEAQHGEDDAATMEGGGGKGGGRGRRGEGWMQEGTFGEGSIAAAGK